MTHDKQSLFTTAFSPEDLLGPLNDLERKNAPERLFAAGNIELLRRRPRVSIIGSRQATTAGLVFAAELAQCVVRRRGVVVSGLASGVDRAAHVAAMEASGSTIAVIGTPLSKTYPHENAALQREIMRRDLVVSQFEEGAITTRTSFVQRNRTMALISHGSVIVEAGRKSGTEHQGWEALRLGRTLFLPRALTAMPFDWPRKMLSYGAYLFEGAEELGALLDELLPGVPQSAPSEVCF